jgi:nitrogen regulatory protein P-II 1
MTVSEVRGFGRQKRPYGSLSGYRYAVDFVAKLMVTILATDDRVPSITEAIAQGARTGKMGDGKIFVTPVDEVVRIRNGEHGGAAI